MYTQMKRKWVASALIMQITQTKGYTDVEYRDKYFLLA